MAVFDVTLVTASAQNVINVRLCCSTLVCYLVSPSLLNGGSPCRLVGLFVVVLEDADSAVETMIRLKVT